MAGPKFNLKKNESKSLKASGSGSSGSMNPFQMMILKQQMDSGKKEQAVQSIPQVMGEVRNSFGGNVPPGTNVKAGDVSFDMNPKLDSEQSKAVAASTIYPGIKNQVMDLIRGGTLNSQKGLFGMGSGVMPEADRTLRQYAVENSNPLATYYDPHLQDLQSKIKKLQELMFERGGTALTDTERDILGSAFMLHGKSDDQIINDIGYADSLVEAKSKIALGGSDAARQLMSRSPIPGSPGYQAAGNQQGQDEDPLGLFK